MASLHIDIKAGASNFAVKTTSCIARLRDVANNASEVLAIANAYIGPATTAELLLDLTYAPLAAAWGVTNSEAKASYDYWVAAQGNLTGNKISNLIDRLG